MYGSEKQINWANSIKAELLPVLQSATEVTLNTENRGRRGGPGYSIELQEEAKDAIRSAISHDSASDWIDWRNNPANLALIAKYGNLYPSNDVELKNVLAALIRNA